MPRAALLVLAGLFAWTAGVQAQTLQVSGLVTGAQGGGEVGVTIVVKENPATGTTTDSKGYYSIKVPSADATLIFSYLGYKTVEIPVSGRTRIDVQMQEDATEVDESWSSVVFQKVCLGRSLQILQICKYNNSCF